MKNNTTYELAYNHIVKETNKAICLNVMVSWNGTCRDRDVWFPKSVITFVEFTDSKGTPRKNAVVQSWFIHKAEKDNAFHGYEMHFETLFNGRNQDDLKAYVVDLTCNCNCFEGTEFECLKEIEDLVINYGNDRNRYAISYTRFD